MERGEGGVEVGHAAALGDCSCFDKVRSRKLGGAGLDMSWRGVGDLNVEGGNGWVRGVRRLIDCGAGGVLAFLEQAL